MFIGVGVGAFSAGVFHLVTHAFFKACLFLGSGSVIHAMSGEQDIRKMGGLEEQDPADVLARSPSPPTRSPDCRSPPASSRRTRSSSARSSTPYFPMVGKIVWLLGTLAAFCTAFYMYRLVYLTFFGEFRGTHEQEHHLHESPATMTVPLWILAGLSVVGGALSAAALTSGTAGRWRSGSSP